jgi:hypothetical protein
MWSGVSLDLTSLKPAQALHMLNGLVDGAGREFVIREPQVVRSGVGISQLQDSGLRLEGNRAPSK